MPVLMYSRGGNETIHVMNKPRLIVTVLTAGAVTLAAVSLSAGSTHTRGTPATTTGIPASEGLDTVQHRVQQWLASVDLQGFHVSEVMAFNNNDYVAVTGKSGRPAFELLTAPNSSWVMEEPASMMWNTRYGMLHGTRGTGEPIPGMSMMWGGGMMGGSSSMMGSPSNWYAAGGGKVTSVAQAVDIANAWLAKARPGERAEADGRAFPGYFTIDTTRSGKTAGMLSVNSSSGAVWYHGWHGTFLSERQFS